MQHWPLQPQTLLPTVYAETRLSPSSCPYLSQAHCSVFGRLGYSLRFRILVKELPLAFFFFVCLFFLTISMPTVKYPLYFRYVLNSLYLFLVLCFCLKKKRKKRKSDGCHMSARPAYVSSWNRQDAISPLVPLFRRFCLPQCLSAIWNRGQRWRCIHCLWASVSFPWVSNSPLLVPSTSVVC